MDILKNRMIYLTISIVLFVFSIGLLIIPKLNLGIDMTGGTQTEYTFKNEVNLEKTRTDLNNIGEKILLDGKKIINDVNAYTISGEKKLVVIAGFDNSIEEKTLEKLKNDFREQTISFLNTTDTDISETSYTNIGKNFGDYIKNTAILTLIIAIIAIAIYVTYAFSGVITGISIYSFSLITIITLFHDVIISSGLYIFTSMYLPEFKIDTFFITALLTILGYSINDTIVVFDRIRHNLMEFGGKKGNKGKTLYEIINLSINETLKRSIYTSLTLFFVLFTIFFFGPESIKGFILVMLFGTIIGTYSSIFLASPILYITNKNNILQVYKKKIIKNEDKIVV